MTEPLIELPTGWHAIKHDDYHSKIFGVGSTTLKHFSRSAAHGRYFSAFEDEQQLRLGSVVHMAILEPEEFENIPVEPPGDGRTKTVKDARLMFKVLLGGRKYASEKDMNIAREIRDMLFAHPTWKALTAVSGVNENTGIYNDGSGIVLKIKPDRRAHSEFLIDLKTTDDARQKSFDTQVVRNALDSQAAYYFDTANKISPNTYKKFIWVALEINPPYGVMFYEVGDLWLEIGREKYHQAMLKYVNAKLSGAYPCYTEQIVVSIPPPYAQFV